MSTADPFAAELLEASATGYAAAAASELLGRNPELEVHDGPVAIDRWRAHNVQRVLELAAALRLGEPEIFLDRVRWVRKAYRTRQVADTDLRQSLECLREVLEERLPEGASALATEWLADAAGEFDRPAELEPRELDPDRDPDRLALRYLLSVLEGDVRGAVDLVFAALDDGLPVESAYVDVVLAAQREIGRMWHVGDSNIAEEHLVTSTAQRVMSLLSRHGDLAPATGPTVVAAAVAGNEHDMAVRALADFYDRAGWRSLCLGADIPPSDVADAVVYFGADLLVLSVTLSTQLRAAEETIAAVRQIEELNVPVLVGGAAFASAPDVWRTIGADGHVDSLRDAVSAGAKLVEKAGS